MGLPGHLSPSPCGIAMRIFQHGEFEVPGLHMLAQGSQGSCPMTETQAGLFCFSLPIFKSHADQINALSTTDVLQC